MLLWTDIANTVITLKFFSASSFCVALYWAGRFDSDLWHYSIVQSLRNTLYLMLFCFLFFHAAPVLAGLPGAIQP